MSTPLKLVILLIGALLVAVAARSLYISLGASDTVDSPEQVRMRTAAADLPAGLLLRNEDLEWRTVDPDSIPDGAVLEQDGASLDITGVMVRRHVRLGSPILERDVIRPNAPGFLSAVLKPGMRAASIAVDSVTGNAGLIQPGDFVDLILVQEAARRNNVDLASERARSVVSETVVENARVIAVGSSFQPSVDDPGTGSDSRAAMARTVTIEVRPRAAEAIAVASRLGSLTLALRSFAITDRNSARESDMGAIAGSQGEPAEGPLWAGDVSRAIASEAAAARRLAEDRTDTAEPVPPTAAAPPPRRQAPREITVYRGSQQATQLLDSTISSE